MEGVVNRRRQVGIPLGHGLGFGLSMKVVYGQVGLRVCGFADLQNCGIAELRIC